jgi:hypothetical protein
VLLARFVPAGLSNPAAQPLDLAIQRERNSADGGQQASNTSQGDQQKL